MTPRVKCQIMSVMIEVRYRRPVDEQREIGIVNRSKQFGGVVTCRELPDKLLSEAICLTIEFSDYTSAKSAADSLRDAGENIDGPMDYGDE